MLIKNWMSTNPIYVHPTNSLAKCQRLLKEKSIQRLPVVDNDGRIVGIISDRDVKSASPSKATSLEVHEMQYIISEIKVKDIMTPNPIVVKPDQSISSAALLMLEHRFGGLPVVDDDGKLVGIITDQDIFKVLVSISGARVPGIEFTVQTSNQPGSLSTIFEILRRQGARIVSVMTQYVEADTRQIFIRIHSPESPQQEQSLRQALENSVAVLEWIRSK